MAAFEELGIMPEIIKAVEDMDWLLPTPVQQEAVPLILGGDDVLAAAETGSGKTGAFAMPIVQIVHEVRYQSNLNSISQNQLERAKITINPLDRDAELAVDETGLLVQSREELKWCGARANLGVLKGRYQYEATVTDEGLCRVGWSAKHARLDLGTCPSGFGFGGTGKKSNNRSFQPYGEAFGLGDVIGCCFDGTTHTLSFTKNGTDFGCAFMIPQALWLHPLYPALVLKNAEMRFNFGDEPFAYPIAGFAPLSHAPPNSTHISYDVA